MKHALCVAALTAAFLQGERVMAEEAPLKVFVLAGQSNMVGRSAKASELPEDLKGEQKGALFFDGRGWIPLAPGKTEPQGFGPEISFARKVGEELKEPIGIVKHSVGGTSLAADWAPEDPKSLYAQLARKVAAAQKSRKIEIVGMVWMQGARDARDAAMAEAYAANLAKFIAAARKDYQSPDMFFVACRSNPAAGERFPFAGVVRKAQQECPARRYAWIDCDPIPKGPDDLHYTTEGYVALGYCFADAMLKLIRDEAARPLAR